MAYLRKINLPSLRQQNVIYSSQFDIDLQAQIREGLWCCSLHIFHLHTLRGHAQDSVTNTLYLRCQFRREVQLNEPIKAVGPLSQKVIN